jgi:tetratricopeptide (TPR) repeat protein
VTGSDDGDTIERPNPAIAALEEERDHLLRSLDQLDQEHADGDIDDDDHRELADGYTARAAAVMRRIDELRGSSDSASSDSSTASPSPSGGDAKRAASGVRRTVIVVALVLFATGAGFALAQASGERGVRDQLTGGIDDSARTKVLTCQELGAGGSDLLGALECFDEVLAEDPDNVEALAYRGWYLVLAAGSVEAATTGEEEVVDAEELRAAGLTYIDRAIEIDPTYPDPLAFKAIIFDRMGDSEEACAQIDALVALDPPQFFIDQTVALASRNGC